MQPRKLRSLFVIKLRPTKGNGSAASNETEPGNDHRTPCRDVLELSYQQICNSYHNISDFRAKLLALLPLATGAGGILLLREREQVRALGPIGLFGVVVTAGLFMYEVRGIQRCHTLERQAGVLEQRLQLGTRLGQFLGDPGRILGFVGPPGAGVITYGAVAFAWLYVAGVGFDWWSDEQQANAWWLVAGYVGWLVASLTIIYRQHRRNRKASTVPLTKGLAGGYSFALMAADGQSVMTSGSYDTRAAALDAIESLQGNGLNADLEDQTVRSPK
jgi:uncharacterized protein